METETKKITVFGYGLSLILLVVAIKLFREHGWVFSSIAFQAGSFVFLFLTTFKRELIVPVYKYWMIVAFQIGNLVTTFILSIIFYCIFGLAGIMLKLLDKDLLNRRIDRQKDSHWIKRPTQAFDKNNYTRQF